jgi:hypothetical protein
MTAIKRIEWRLLLLLLGGVFCSADLAAQEDNWQDFAYIRQSEAWLGSENASGLQYLPVRKISLAEVFLNKSDGKFVNYHQSGNSSEYGAQTESFFRLNPKVVLYGKINYTHFNGKNMNGSVFIDPAYNAFDILTDAGDKNLEKYDLSGAVGIQLSSRWALGGKLDYEAANYAKFKDLRNENMLLNLTFSAGFSYRIGSKLALGANYFYLRRVESLAFSLLGTTDKQYNSLISFGSFFGRTELFGESGYTQKGNNNPTVNTSHGVSLQADWKWNRQWRLFNEFSYKSGDGYYGKQSTTTPVYTEHHFSGLAYSGALSFKDRHFLNVKLGNQQLDNFENVFVRENQPGGNTNIVYYGNNKVLDKSLMHVNLEYTANLGVEAYHPTWVLKAGADFHDRRQTTMLYPFFRKQDIRVFDGWLSAGRNIVRQKNQYALSLKLLYGSGGGTDKEDGVYATPSDSQREPARADNELHREYEYLTTGRIRANLGIGYTRLLNPDLQGYIRLNYELTHAPQVEYLNGKTFGAAVLSAGCVF